MRRLMKGRFGPLILLAGVALVLLLLVGITVALLSVVSSPDQKDTTPKANGTSAAGETPQSSGDADDLELPTTEDPDEYAAAVAELVYGMDYVNHTAADYRSVLTTALHPLLRSDIQAGRDDAIRLHEHTWLSGSGQGWDYAAASRTVQTFKVDSVLAGPDAEAASAMIASGVTWGPAPESFRMRIVRGTQTSTFEGEDNSPQELIVQTSALVWMSCDPVCRLQAVSGDETAQKTAASWEEIP